MTYHTLEATFAVVLVAATVRMCYLRGKIAVYADLEKRFGHLAAVSGSVDQERAAAVGELERDLKGL